ncbi:MAG: secretin N-terminal domain-containing protein [Planctomycetota bacterium]|nr:secretin N-terminal domain-containing protein [Planctomycetota bacterium]
MSLMSAQAPLRSPERASTLRGSWALGLLLLAGLPMSAMAQQTDTPPEDRALLQPAPDPEAQAEAEAAGSVFSPPGVAPAPGQPPSTTGRPTTLPGRVVRTGQQPGQQPGQPNGAPAAPGAGVPGAGDPASPLATTDDGKIRFDAFSEPVELSALVEYVARSLAINITIKGQLTGQVAFNAPVAVEPSQLLALLAALLEQQNFTLLHDPVSTFYSVVAINEVGLNLKGDMPSTRVFATPNVRPSALKAAIDQQLTGAVGIQGGGVAGNKISAIDDLGVIVATDTPRRLAQIESLIGLMLEAYAKAQFLRIDLRHVAAPTARERALQLVGVTSQSRSPFGNIGEVPQQVPGIGGSQGRLDNLGDRLTIDPQGNALIFRGLPEEIEQVQRIVEVIDVPNNLVPTQYFAGSAAKQVADLARVQGFGEVVTISTLQNSGNQNFNFGFDEQTMRQLRGGSGNNLSGGPVMVVDESRGTIIYYGTAEQQRQLATLIKTLDITSESIVVRNYKLKHSDAEEVANLVLSLLQNRTLADDASPLLPGGTGSQQRNRSSFRQPADERQAQDAQAGDTGDGGLVLEASDDVFVVADKANNQVLVKAPAKNQKDFEKLITSLDLRRPQVYIEAMIVALTADDTTRLAFETQLINANGTGGVINTNFGLSSFPTPGSLTTRKVPSTGLAGFTGAVIKSDQVPIIINAIKRETDSRIISTPQLLVDDNEEAEVVSVNTEPIPQVNRGTSGQGDIITSGGEAEAGTTLRVTPQISEGGYLRLKYEIELSSFTGESQNNLPPPAQRNNIKADSVTVPSDSTIVVGGLVLDSNTRSIAKVPLLGDIPLIGLLFQDRNIGKNNTTLYVFLKPRIMRDQYFRDSKLNTRGPFAASGMKDPLEPPLKATYIEIVTPQAVVPSPSQAPSATDPGPR